MVNYKNNKIENIQELTWKTFQSKKKTRTKKKISLCEKSLQSHRNLPPISITKKTSQSIIPLTTQPSQYNKLSYTSFIAFGTHHLFLTFRTTTFLIFCQKSNKNFKKFECKIVTIVMKTSWILSHQKVIRTYVYEKLSNYIFSRKNGGTRLKQKKTTLSGCFCWVLYPKARSL